ncbi:flippase [Nanoarchaeota archaeon]
MATYTKRIVRGSAFLFMMSILAGIIGYIIRIVLARNLTPSEYGLFYAIFAFVSFLLFFRDLGLNQALVKYIPEFKINQKFNKIKTAISSAFFGQVVSSLILGILLFIFSGFLAEHYFKDLLAIKILRILIIYVFFSMFVILLLNIFRGFQKIKTFSSIEPIRNTIMLIFVLVLLNRGAGVLAPAYAFVISWIALSIILAPLFIKTFNFFKYKIKNLRKTTKLLFAFSLPVLLTTVGAYAIATIDTLVLTYFTTLDQVGIYNVVLPSAMMFLFFCNSLATVAFPIISELWAKKEIIKITEWVRLLYKYSFVVITPLLVSLLVFSEIFIRVFFGEQYVAGANAFRILLVGVLFFIVAKLNNITLSGIGKPAIVTRIILMVALFNFIANVALVPRFGIEGAAFATAVSYLIVLVMSTYKTTKFVEVKVPINAWLKTIIASLAFVGVIGFLKRILFMNIWLEVIISLLVAFAVYAILIYLLKLIDVAEIKKYAKLIK